MSANRTKPRLLLALAVSVAAVAGCQWVAKGRQPKRFATPDGLIAFQFPGDWRLSRGKHPFDLQCVSRNERMVTNVFEYKREDLAASSTPHATLQTQIADLRAKRERFEIVEPEQTLRNGETTLTTAVWAGEKAESRYYYRFTLIESAAAPSVFAVVLQTSMPSEWATNKPILEGITLSATIGPPASR